MSLTSWTTRFSQIHHPTLRGRVRHAALSGLALGARLTGSIDRALKRPRVHFIYLHHVFEDEVEPFRDLVRTLTTIMRPIDYSEGVERILGNRIDRPYITFSFDDGFKNCLTAAKVLEEFGARACFFVCPKIVGERDRAAVEEFARERLHLPPVEFMNWNDLEGLMKRGHEIGNHTASHVNLASLDPLPRTRGRGQGEGESADPVQSSLAHASTDPLTLTLSPEYGGEGTGLVDEIAGSFELLRSRLGNSIRHFAWPYGHFGAVTKPAIDAVFQSGHRSTASGQRGAHVVGATAPDQICIRRDHVIAAWPKSHVLYLLAKSAKRASAADNDWPASLR